MRCLQGKFWLWIVLLYLPVCRNFCLAKNRTVPVEKSPIFLTQGEQKLIQIHNLSKYSLGSQNIRALSIPKSSGNSRTLNDFLLIKGVSLGNGDLWVWKKDGTIEHRMITVEKLNNPTFSPYLKKSLGKLNELEILYSGSGVILRGKLNSWEECSNAAALIHGFPNQVQDEISISDSLLDEGEKRLREWIIHLEDSPNLRIERSDQNLWLRGTLKRPSTKLALEKQARFIFPMIHLEIESLPSFSPTIHFRVFLLELKRNEFQAWGLSWPSEVERIFHVTPSHVQSLFDLNVALQQAEGSGHAKILSNPQLVVRAPGEAELFSGGELPIHLQQKYLSNVSWKKYGLTLKLKITHSTSDQIRLEIFTEVSHLDLTSSQAEIPRIQSNRMQTQVDAQFKVPLLLSGLLQEGIREEIRGLPYLQKIPILGSLFSSKDYLSHRSELVVILYPELQPFTTLKSPAASQENQQPRGPVPLPRNQLNLSEERALRASKDYPWNALQ